jgi:hypothetical protein
MVSSLPGAARAMFRVMLDLLSGLSSRIADLDKEIARRAQTRSMTVNAPTYLPRSPMTGCRSSVPKPRSSLPPKPRAR